MFTNTTDNSYINITFTNFITSLALNKHINSLVTASVNFVSSGMLTLKSCNIFKSVNKASMNGRFCQSIICSYVCIQYYSKNSLFLSNFIGLNCSKIRNACFPTPGIAPKHALLSSAFAKQTVCNFRKRQVQYLTLVGNDSRSSLRRPSYSFFIRASLANPLFPCSYPIGIQGNLVLTAKWSTPIPIL